MEKCITTSSLASQHLNILNGSFNNSQIPFHLFNINFNFIRIVSSSLVLRFMILLTADEIFFWNVFHANVFVYICLVFHCFPFFIIFMANLAMPNYLCPNYQPIPF